MTWRRETTRESGTKNQVEGDRGSWFELVSGRIAVMDVAMAFKRVPESFAGLAD
jgi:hypothetical protein